MSFLEYFSACLFIAVLEMIIAVLMPVYWVCMWMLPEETREAVRRGDYD